MFAIHIAMYVGGGCLTTLSLKENDRVSVILVRYLAAFREN